MKPGFSAKIAETKLDEGQKIEKAVITVPAYFNNHQRKATIRAAEEAKLKVLKIINGPTAAAISFGYEKGLAAGKKIMIFDLGGGTFDVTILETGSNNYFTVQASEGDMHLGGEDFN